MVGAVVIKGSREYYDGQINYYDERGILREIVNFKDGYRFGNSYLFYANRRLYKEVVYKVDSHHEVGLKIARAGGVSLDDMCAKAYLMEYLDSLGNKIVTNGNGNVNEEVNYFGEKIIERGSYVNGLKEGSWELIVKDGDKTYVENYLAGKVINGILKSNNSSEKYTKVFKEPKFPYFENRVPVPYGTRKGAFPLSFEQYLKSEGFKYTGGMHEINVYAELYLIIDEKGKFVDLETVTLLPLKVVDDLRKILRKMPAFSPALYRGQKIEVKYPIYLFGLSYPANI